MPLVPRDASDVWYGRNQPYGYWRVGNPVVKIATVLVLAVGALTETPYLILQGSAVLVIMLFAPCSTTSKAYNFVVNFGLGSVAVALLGPRYLPYDKLAVTTNIPGVTEVDWLMVGSFVIMMVVLATVRRAATSRDYAWIIDALPSTEAGLRVGGAVFAFSYGLLRGPSLLWMTRDSLQARGVPSPFAWTSMKSPDAAINIWGLWVLAIFRKLFTMADTVHYNIASRLRPGFRRTPILRYWSATDLSIAGLIVVVIVF